MYNFDLDILLWIPVRLMHRPVSISREGFVGWSWSFSPLGSISRSANSRLTCLFGVTAYSLGVVRCSSRRFVVAFRIHSVAVSVLTKMKSVAQQIYLPPSVGVTPSKLATTQKGPQGFALGIITISVSLWMQVYSSVPICFLERSRCHFTGVAASAASSNFLEL